jgi:glycosyltransferase involved in cell wall biosynthesis
MAITTTTSATPSTRAAGPLSCSAVLTHHWLVRRRGGEKVLEALAALLPDAAVHTLVHDPDAYAGPCRTVRTSLLQRIPGARRHYPKLFPLMPLAARMMRLPEVDLVLCSDAALAKAMRPHPRSLVVCYCHSPMRYVWEPDVQRDYLRALAPPLRLPFRIACANARRVDYRAAQRVDFFLANSRHVADRIRRHYDRESVVIHPPVDIPPEPPGQRPAGVSAGTHADSSPSARQGRPSVQQIDPPRADFYLCVGHHVPYKRLDLAVEATRALGRRLVVIGEGPDAKQLQRMPNNAHVSWLGWQSDEVIADHYRRARALLFPGEEDFGIVPVEAQAHGCPVIAYGVGGATETVLPGETGVLFEQQSTDALAAAIKQIETLRFDPSRLYAHARKFSLRRFLWEARQFIDDHLTPRPSIMWTGNTASLPR